MNQKSNPLKKIAVFPGIFMSGGVESVVMSIFERSDKNTFAFDFYVSRNFKGPLDDKIISQGGRIFYIPRISKTGFFKYLRTVKLMLISNGNYYAVHIHSIHTGVFNSIAAFFARIKIRIFHVHNTNDPLFQKGALTKIQRGILRKLIYIFNNRFIACSLAAARYVYSKRIMARKSFSIFHNCIDLDVFKPSQNNFFREMLPNLTKDSIVLGNAARFTKVKNQAFLLKIVEYVNRSIDCRLLLAGDGETIQDCKNLTNELSLNNKVLFLGNIKEINRFYNSIDVFILPSLYEGLPVSVVEAQACGIPVLVSETITSEVDMELGLVKFLSIEDDFSKWAEAIFRLSRDKIVDKVFIRESFDKKGYNSEKMKTYIDTIYL